MKTLSRVLSVFLVLPPLLWAQQPDRARVLSREKEIRALESALMNAAEEKGSAGYMSFYAEDAVELPNGAQMILSKESIAKTMTFLDDKNNKLTWSPVHIDVSASGDLAYSFGNYEFRSVGPDGKPLVERGKYTTIWKKRKDGPWKVVLDMGNANPAPPEPASR
jgi:ketosteroid isomerase-like protein